MPTVFENIKLITTDFDGIITDGFVFYGANPSDDVKRVSFKDIMGMSLAIKNGFKLAIISGEKANAIDRVQAKFNIEDVHQGVREKLPVLLSIAEKYSLDLSEICYLGDDINDIPILEKVGFSVSVPGANYKVLRLPNIFVTKAQAGDGAFREIVDLLIDKKAGVDYVSKEFRSDKS